MRRHRRYKPYIRRRHPGDKSESFRVAIQMEFYGPDCYVMLQRGWPGLAVAAAPTKRKLLRGLIGVREPNGRSFRRFANRFGRYARNEQ